MSVFYPTEAIYQMMGRWWDIAPGGPVYQSLFATVDALRREQVYIEQQALEAVKLYENCSPGNMYAWQFSTYTGLDAPYQFNLIESLVDTIHAEIITAKTRPQFITSGGDFLAQERAEDLTRFCDGIFYENKVHDNILPRVVLDALVYGTGVAKSYVGNDSRVRVERVFPWEVIVDDIEASGGDPSHIYHERLVDRGQLKGLYHNDPEAIKLIDAVEAFSFPGSMRSRSTTDLVRVIEGWHVANDYSVGKHTICINNGTLLYEDYEKRTFPFKFLRYKERTKGFWGKGIPEILEGQQELINGLRDKINAQIMGASPFIWSPPGTRLQESAISNEQWRVIESESPPQHIAYQAVPQDLFTQYAQEIEQAANIVGVNMVMLKGEMPPGLESPSGKALRIYNDTKSKRYMRFARGFESFTVHLAELMIDLADDSMETLKEYVAVSEFDGEMSKIDYRDIQLPRGSFVIRPYPVPFLSDTPSGRISDIEALANIMPDQFKPYLVRMLRFPDVQSVTDLVDADTNAIQKVCSKILRGEAMAAENPPLPFMDLDLCVTIARNYAVLARSNSAPEDRVGELLNWIDMAIELQGIGMPPEPPPGAMVGEEDGMGAEMPMDQDMMAEQLPAVENLDIGAPV